MKLSTEHDSITAIFCEKFWKYWAAEKYGMGKVHIVIFQFGGKSHNIVAAARAPFYLHGLTLIPAWISNLIRS